VVSVIESINSERNRRTDEEISRVNVALSEGDNVSYKNPKMEQILREEERGGGNPQDEEEEVQSKPPPKGASLDFSILLKDKMGENL